MSEVFLSLAVLARDPEGAETLERALRSALNRPDGPMFDEIVVLFGGTPHARCREIVSRLALEFPEVACRGLDLPANLPRTDDGGLADFAAARNFLYSQCHGAWIGYIDADDVIPSAEAAEAKAAMPVASSTTMKAFLRSLPHAFNSASFAYHYAYDHLDNVIVESTREWVRWRDGFTWVNRAPGHHEALFPLFPNRRSVATIIGFYLEHRPPDDAAGRRVRRNDTLLDAATHMHLADRWGVNHYLSRQAERRNDYALAVKHGEAALIEARNDEEKYTSLHGLARVLRYLGRNVESMSTAMLAYNLAPLRGEALADMVNLNVEIGDPVRAAEWYGRLLAIPPATAHPGVEYNAYETDLWAHISASRAFLALERFDEAVAAADVALRFAAYDVGAIKARSEAAAARDLRQARDAARCLLAYAARHDDARRVIGLSEYLPYAIDHDDVIAAIVAQVNGAAPATATAPATAARLMAESPNDGTIIVMPYGTAPDGPVAKRLVYTPERLLRSLRRPDVSIERLERVPPDDTDPYREGVVVAKVRKTNTSGRLRQTRVVFFCPAYVERWGPFAPERTGIGGSEEMVIHVARHLAARGADVTVYAPVDDLVVDRSVVWRPTPTFDPEAPCDVLISHRTAHLARREKIGARVHYAWLHDAVVGRMAEDYEETRRSRVRAYLTISAWQKEEYHARYGIPHDQMWHVPNAPDPDDRLPEDEAARIPHRAIYAAAPYRGLHVLLDAWPLVREIVPGAELHVCANWKVYDALAKEYPELRPLKDAILTHQEAPGVVWRGRLTAQALRHEFQMANLLVYPSTFQETSCRTAIRAMACGCLPVYRPLAALEETIGPLGVAVPGDPSEPTYLRAFANAVAEAMIHPRTAAERRVLSEDATRRHDPWPTWRLIATSADKVMEGATT